MCEAAEKDLYAVLGASPSDSVQQLRHRYQQLALQVNTLLSVVSIEATHTTTTTTTTTVCFCVYVLCLCCMKISYHDYSVYTCIVKMC